MRNIWKLQKKRIIPDHLSVDLESIVKKNELLEGDNNWINLERLFSLKDQCFIEPVSRDIYDRILQREDYGRGQMLIGVDYYGAIVAAVIGYKFDIPFTYCFDETRYVDDIEREIEDIENLEKMDLIVITDVVNSGRRIGRLLNTLYNKNIVSVEKKLDVIALFERKTKTGELSELYGNPLIRRIIILSNPFL